MGVSKLYLLELDVLHVAAGMLPGPASGAEEEGIMSLPGLVLSTVVTDVNAPGLEVSLDLVISYICIILLFTASGRSPSCASSMPFQRYCRTNEGAQLFDSALSAYQFPDIVTRDACRHCNKRHM